MQTIHTPTVEIGAHEHASGDIRDDHLVSAVELFREHGYVKIGNAFPAEYMARLQHSYRQMYASFMNGGPYDDALCVGDRRYITSLRFEAPFNDPFLYANPLLYPILQSILGEDCIIAGLETVISLPGSGEQKAHRDHPMLYGDAQVDASTPPFALTVTVPMIEMNEVNGTTRMYPESMHDAHRDEATMAVDEPRVEVGSAIFFDFKIKHGGTPNRGSEPRPLLYLLYSRPWFRDTINCDKHAPVVMTEKEYAGLPDEYRHMFALATTPDGFWLPQRFCQFNRRA
jgi:ectoine hydroxylase-related dioxygenase (phytanoyl-CoA dioxygenase family)